MLKDDLKGDENCTICSGVGYIVSYKEVSLYKNSMPIWKRCDCLKKKKINVRLKTFSQIEAANDSPLIKKLKENLFIKSSLETFKSHLRSCIEQTNEKFKFLCLSDDRLLEIAFKTDPDFESIQELLKFDLLILFFGFVGYQNHAALPGLITSILNLRLLDDKPTWIHTSKAFTKNVVEYSDELNNILVQEFEEILLDIKPSEKQGTFSLRNPEKQPNSISNINDLIRG